MEMMRMILLRRYWSPKCPTYLRNLLRTNEELGLGKNAGQVLKEFPHTSGIDTSMLDGKELGTYRTHIHK